MRYTTKEQTMMLEKLRERLQSIAILAVQAQNVLGNVDAVSDLLSDIETDTNVAYKLTEALRG
jgi:chaperonin cofactor prefoldin